MADVVATPVPEIEPVFPLWAREPAKVVGWIVTIVFVAGGGLVELLNETVDVLPHGWQTPVRTVTVTIAGVVVVAGRVQTWLTRNGLGKPGNNKDGVWSPAAVAVAAEVTKAQAATPEAIHAATAERLKPPAATTVNNVIVQSSSSPLDDVPPLDDGVAHPDADAAAAALVAGTPPS